MPTNTAQKKEYVPEGLKRLYMLLDTILTEKDVDLIIWPVWDAIQRVLIRDFEELEDLICLDDYGTECETGHDPMNGTKLLLDKIASVINAIDARYPDYWEEDDYWIQIVKEQLELCNEILEWYYAAPQSQDLEHHFDVESLKDLFGRVNDRVIEIHGGAQRGVSKEELFIQHSEVRFIPTPMKGEVVRNRVLPLLILAMSMAYKRRDILIMIPDEFDCENIVPAPKDYWIEQFLSGFSEFFNRVLKEERENLWVYFFITGPLKKPVYDEEEFEELANWGEFRHSKKCKRIIDIYNKDDDSYLDPSLLKALFGYASRKDLIDGRYIASYLREGINLEEPESYLLHNVVGKSDANSLLKQLYGFSIQEYRFLALNGRLIHEMFHDEPYAKKEYDLVLREDSELCASTTLLDDAYDRNDHVYGILLEKWARYIKYHRFPKYGPIDAEMIKKMEEFIIGRNKQVKSILKEMQADQDFLESLFYGESENAIEMSPESEEDEACDEFDAEETSKQTSLEIISFDDFIKEMIKDGILWKEQKLVGYEKRWIINPNKKSEFIRRIVPKLDGLFHIPNRAIDENIKNLKKAKEKERIKDRVNQISKFIHWPYIDGIFIYNNKTPDFLHDYNDLSQTERKKILLTALKARKNSILKDNASEG